MSPDKGIHIDREVAEEAAIPEDLDSGAIGPYQFPDPRRRRISGVVYLVVGAAMIPAAVGRSGIWLVIALLALAGVWHLVSAWPLGTSQEEVLAKAAQVTPFAVGHVSTAITFHGIRSKPRWHVVLYSADEPPSQRALVQFDATSGEQVEEIYLEAVPEN